MCLYQCRTPYLPVLFLHLRSVSLKAKDKDFMVNNRFLSNDMRGNHF